MGPSVFTMELYDELFDKRNTYFLSFLVDLTSCENKNFSLSQKNNSRALVYAFKK